MSFTHLVRAYRPLIGVAAPITGIQLAQIALTTTDLVMVGSLSMAAIAAAGLAITLYNQLRTMCVGVVTAVGNLVAGATGRGETRSGADELDEYARDEVRRIVRASFLVATLVAVVGGAALIALSYALAWFGQDSRVLELARPMMAPGLIPMLWLNVLRQFAVGTRRPGSLLGVTIVSVGINAALDGAFIYGWFGLPILGITGVGVATTLVQVVNFVAFLGIVRRNEYLAPLISIRAWKTDLASAREVVRLGAPICLTYGSEAGITSVATVLMGGFGPAALAAHNVVNHLAYIVYQVNIGLSQGSSILVSRSVGRGSAQDARQIARKALGLSSTIMTVVGLVYLVVPNWVLQLFLGQRGNSAVESAAGTLLFFAIAHQFLKGAQNIGGGLLRGLGDTKTGFRMSLVGYWAVGLPVMLLFAYGLGLDGPGVWVGLCGGFGATAVLLLRRFRRDLHAVPAAALSHA